MVYHLPEPESIRQFCATLDLENRNGDLVELREHAASAQTSASGIRQVYTNGESPCANVVLMQMDRCGSLVDDRYGNYEEQGWAPPLEDAA